MKKSKNISVWIVEDNELFQKNLSTLIDDQDDMKCDRIFSSCEEVLSEIKHSSPPDVVLQDIGFVGMNGIACVEVIKRKYPQTQIIILTIYDDGDHIFDALRAGATGYLLKSSSEEIIISSIHDVLAGGSPMNSSVARKVAEYFSHSRKTGQEYKLSSREKEILEFIIQGYSNNMIADKLHLSGHTIDAHLRKVYVKLHVHSRTEATTKALKEKLI